MLRCDFDRFIKISSRRCHAGEIDVDLHFKYLSVGFKFPHRIMV